MDGFTHNVERLVLDVMSNDNVQDVVRTIVEKEGRIDVLVNNAGVLCTGRLGLCDKFGVLKSFLTSCSRRSCH